MPDYNLKTAVPWRDVLRVLQWHLKMRIRDYRQYGDLPDGVWRRRLIEDARQGVEESCRTYSAVRKFLGYHSKTAVLREALEIMQNTPEIPPEPHEEKANT